MQNEKKNPKQPSVVTTSAECGGNKQDQGRAPPPLFSVNVFRLFRNLQSRYSSAAYSNGGVACSRTAVGVTVGRGGGEVARAEVLIAAGSVARALACTAISVAEEPSHTNEDTLKQRGMAAVQSALT